MTSKQATIPATDRSHRCSIFSVLSARAAATTDAPAISAPGRAALSFRGSRDRVAELVDGLSERGLGRGDRVVLVLPDGPDMLVAFLAAVGATAAPLNPASTTQEIGFYLNDLGAKAVVVGADVDSPTRAAATERGLAIIELVSAPADPAGVCAWRGEARGRPVRGGYVEPGETARVRHALRVEISLPRFFEAPTVAGLATAIAAQHTDTVDADEPTH